MQSREHKVQTQHGNIMTKEKDVANYFSKAALHTYRFAQLQFQIYFARKAPFYHTSIYWKKKSLFQNYKGVFMPILIFF